MIALVSARVGLLRLVVRGLTGPTSINRPRVTVPAPASVLCFHKREYNPPDEGISMETLVLIGLGFGCVVGLGVLVYRVAFSPRARGRRALERTPRTPIGEIRKGEMVKVIGHVRFAVEPLRAPMSGRPCVCWHVRVQEARQGAQGGSWIDVLDEVEGQELLLEDGTGIALVRGVMPEATLASSGPWIDNYVDDFPPEVQGFFQGRGQQVRGALGKRVMRYEERILDEGAQVAVLGMARQEGVPESASVVIDCLDDGRIVISNSPSALR